MQIRKLSSVKNEHTFCTNYNFYNRKQIKSKTNQTNKNTFEEPRRLVEPKENMARIMVEPKEVPKQLTDKYGLEEAYETANDISSIHNTLYLAGKR